VRCPDLPSLLCAKNTSPPLVKTSKPLPQPPPSPPLPHFLTRKDHPPSPVPSSFSFRSGDINVMITLSLLVKRGRGCLATGELPTPLLLPLVLAGDSVFPLFPPPFFFTPLGKRCVVPFSGKSLSEGPPSRKSPRCPLMSLFS